MQSAPTHDSGRASTTLWSRLGHLWATRTLGLGLLATILDMVVLLVCKRALRLPTPVCAGSGVFVGSLFTFFANKFLAFHDQHEVGIQLFKFALATTASMVVHAVLVGMLTDRLKVPIVLSKLIADAAVFSVGQLLVLRYLVFPPGVRAAPRRPGPPPSAKRLST